MAIVLDRTEFFALATLFHATEIIGLDTAALLPPAADTRQVLYDQGRDRLRARDLLRFNAVGEVELEQGLRDLCAPVMNPEWALLVVRYLPRLGRQLFLYYGRAARAVEQTLLDDHTHRLGIVGDSEAMVNRLLELLPVSEPRYVPEKVTVPARALAQAFRFVERDQLQQAQSVLAGEPTSDGTLSSYLADLMANAAFCASLTFVKPGSETRSFDIALIQAPDEAWGITASDDRDTLTAERMNATVLRGTLREALRAVAQPLQEIA